MSEAEYDEEIDLGDDMVLIPRSALRRQQALQREPDFPSITPPQEDSYVTLIGAGRYVSRFVNKGEPLLLGQAMFVTVQMATFLLREHYKDVRTKEWRPMFRLSNDKEIEAFKRREGIGASAGGKNRAALAREARESSVRAGHGTHEAEITQREQDALAAQRTQPAALPDRSPKTPEKASQTPSRRSRTKR